MPQDPDQFDAVRQGANEGEDLFFFLVTDAANDLDAQALLKDKAGATSLSTPFSAGAKDLDLAIFGPPTNITVDPPSPTNNPRPTFRWDAPPTGGISDDIASYEIRILPDQADFSTSVGADVTSFTPDSDIADGSHTFQVRAVGNGDRKDAIGSAEFIIVTAPIGPPVLVAPVDFTNDNTPLFDWDAPSVGVPDVYQMQVVTGDNFDGPFLINEGGIVDTEFPSPVTLPDDTYLWRVIVTDAIGNSDTSAGQSFKVDTISPTQPANLTEVTAGDERERVFTWGRSSDPAPEAPGAAGDESGVDKYSVLINPGNITATLDDSDANCPDDLCTFTTPSLPSGSFTIEVRAVDRATNESDAATAEFRAGPRDVVQDLRQVRPLFVNEPRFQFKPPTKLPDADDTVDGGIETYLVTITGDAELAPDFNIPSTPFTNTDFFIDVECFDENERPIGTGGECTRAINPDSRIEFTVLGPVPVGTHTLAIRVRGDGGVLFPEESTTFVVENIVDVKLVVENEYIRAGAEFEVEILVDLGDPPDSGPQPVEAVDALLKFDAGDVEVLSIEPVTGSFDQDGDTIDFSATFEEPRTEDFVLARVSFRAKEIVELKRQTSITLDDPAGETDAKFKGASVLKDAVPADLTLLKPVVDLRLGLEDGGASGGFKFARNELINVLVKLETNGQSVNTVDALLDFDTDTLKVVDVSKAEGSTFDQVLVINVDNANGRLNFSASVDGEAATGNIAVVTFRALRATQSLGVGFHEDFTRKSDAAFRGASVIRNRIGFPMEIALELSIRSFEAPSLDANVVIVVRPNGHRVSAADAFLNTTGDVTVLDIIPGETLEQTPRRFLDFNNATGTADYGSFTVGPAPIGEFELATVSALLGVAGTTNQQILASLDNMKVLFNCYDEDGDLIAECELFLRDTLLAFNERSVADDLTPLRLSPLATLKPSPPGELENLIQLTPANADVVTFQWDPPIVRPSAGMATIEVSINKGITNGLVDYKEIGTIECRDAEFGRLAAGDACFGLRVFGNVTVFRFTLDDRPDDADYEISVRSVDRLGQDGDTRTAAFKIDREAPTVPVPSGRLGVDPADIGFTNQVEPLLEWEPSVDALSDIEYDVEVDLTRKFPNPVDVPTSELSATIENPREDDEYTVLQPGVVYWWRVRAVDDAGRPPFGPLGALGELGGAIGPLAEPVLRLPKRGNASAFSASIRFIIDLVPPAAPEDLVRVSDGNDPTPTFTWKRSTDDFVMDRYGVSISRLGAASIEGEVADANCDDLTNLCTFTVSAARAFRF